MNSFIVYLVPPARNATFTPIFLLSISAAFRTRSSDFGRIILAHLLSSSSVANTAVIGDPCLISKASRASRMALEVASEHDWNIECDTYKPPFSNISSVPMLPTRPRFAKGISNNPFAA